MALVNVRAHTRSAKGEGVQFRDANDNGGSAGYLDPADSNDPNISGTLPTKTPYDWQAGRLSSWQENDDYRDFTYDIDNVAESRLLAQSPFRLARYEPNDGDYDDNGGIPTPVWSETHVTHAKRR